jgi:hypothetical protein
MDGFIMIKVKISCKKMTKYTICRAAKCPVFAGTVPFYHPMSRRPVLSCIVPFSGKSEDSKTEIRFLIALLVTKIKPVKVTNQHEAEYIQLTSVK